MYSAVRHLPDMLLQNKEVFLFTKTASLINN